ncbi:uncharacterized protein [Anabrus simplex]|uniref:uncharacterized protein isoform X3 n=1 Tax=Anabrus simplex TaxID=316456 RepID=UPI0035A286C9
MNIGWFVLLSLSAMTLAEKMAPATCNASVSLIHVKGPQKFKQELRNIQGLSRQIVTSKMLFLGKNKLFRNVYNKMRKILPVLFESLHNFSVTYESMKTYDPLDDTHLQEHREFIINSIISVIKTMLCDVEIMLLNKGIVPPLLKPAASILPTTWMNDDDSQVRLFTEWGVHKIFKRFIEDWKYILKDLVRKKKLRRCQVVTMPRTHSEVWKYR